MNQNRRRFLGVSASGILGAAAGYLFGKQTTKVSKPEKKIKPKAATFLDGLVISTWYHGLAANEKAMELISSGKSSLDAAEAGVMVTESDVTGRSVGIGGTPDREGKVTLDACIMDSKGNAGSVSFLQNILHPISVARKVMEETPHVMLVGNGALQYAKEQGFKEIDLLTDETRKDYKKWLETSEYKPIINIENHDTIGLIAMDKKGDISGACTPSGLGYKMHGRVGDSPVIGAGLFVDNEVGAATATGLGEAVLKTCGTFLVVELMRQGMSPQEACEEAVTRIVKGQDYKDFQIGYIAINKAGEVGAYSIHKGFNYALYKHGENKMVDVASYV